MEYNPEKHYLGKLCKYNHEYENTGKSLRYKNIPRRCKMCSQIKNHEQKYSKKGVELKEKYRLSGQSRCSRKKWNKKNKELVKKYAREAGRRQSNELHNRYIKKIIIQTTVLKYCDITQEMIDLKRLGLQTFRLQKLTRRAICQ